MPHQCTDCGRTFADGSKEMLSGCPDCGGNKFQFKPDGVADPEPADPPEEPPDPAVESSVARTVGSAATAVRDMVSSDPPEAESGPATTTPTASESETPADAADASPADGGEAASVEDTAQASARSDVVSREELPSESVAPPTAETRPTPVLNEDSETSKGEDARERPDLSDLRAELNDQFESIRVLEPGQYELNLMELYDREEYIIALQEDGKYTIQVPEHWKDD